MTPYLTVSEAVTVLAGLGLSLTERQVRYLGLQPAQRWGGRNGGRLFDPADVTLFAVFADLLALCRRLELPMWSARAAIVYREVELRRAVARRSPRFVIVDPTRGTATLSETDDGGPSYAIDVRALAARVTTAARAFRALEPDVWTGAERIPARDLAQGRA